jgi:hypothetical protein
MEINRLKSQKINAYQSVANVRTDTSKTASAAKSQNTDKVEFDFTRSLAAAKANIKSSLEAQANLERIQSLADAYCGDHCPTKAEDTADAVVGLMD